MSTDESTLEDLMVQQALGEALAPADRARLEAALAQDPALQAEMDSLTRTVGHLAFGAQQSPPPSLRARVLASTTPATPITALRGSHPPTQRWPLALAAGVAAIAVAVTAYLVVENRQLRRESAQQYAVARMLLEPNIVKSFQLLGTGTGSGAKGLVLLDFDAKRASIAVSGLSAPSSGQTYSLWAELEDKRVPCGDFQILADGTLLTQFQIPVDSYTSPIVRLVMTDAAGAIVMVSG